METLFVAWQQASSREWIPVARLDRSENEYLFAYTKGALRAEGFRPFGRMDDLQSVYRSEQLFPLFENRLLTRSRPEFSRYFHWTGLSSDFLHDPLKILSITGGLRGTDRIELFPLPVKNENNKLNIDFFIRGMRHFALPNIEAADKLMTGDRLYVMRDVQNEHDDFALCLRTNDPSYLIGYFPKYYTNDICKLLEKKPRNLNVTVKQVNSTAPLTMRLLCTLDVDWPNDFTPFSSNPDFEPMS